MEKVLVFDLGGSSGRAIIYTYDEKGFFSTEIHRFANVPITVGDTMCWDVDNIFKEISKAIEKADAIGFDAVSVDTWGVDFALLDGDGGFVQKPVHYRDSRTDGMPELIRKSISDEELFTRTGIAQQNINTIYQLAAIKSRTPELLKKANHLLMMPDLICHYLTGEYRNEYTEATTTGLVDPKTRNWDWELIEKLGLPKRIFGEMIEPGTVYGTLKADFSSNAVPVIAAPSHDTASAVVAVPSECGDFAFVSCGTWALVGTELEKPVITNDVRLSGLTNEGGANESSSLIKNIMGLWLIQECRRALLSSGEVFTYNDMEAFAKTAPHFVARIDPNDRDFVAPADMLAAVKSYCARTGQTVPQTLAQTLRVIYESLAHQFALALDKIEALTGKTYSTVHIIGGGSKDELLCQMTADAANRRVVAGPSEATGIGNVMCSFISLGCVESYSDARRIVRESAAVKRYSPANHSEWEKAEQKFSAQA